MEDVAANPKKPVHPHVIILLATFNGIRYLKQQIISLNGQINVRISIEVQDDGSTDGTLEYLQELMETGGITKLSRSSRIGSSRVFESLIHNAGEADYYAFSDQDDIWDSTKVSKLIDLIRLENSSALAFCSRKFIDENGDSVQKVEKGPTILNTSNALIENVIPGNTMLLNNKGFKSLRLLHFKNSTHYDAVIYLLFTIMGKIVYCDEKLVRYRLHSKNQIGFRRNRISRIFSTSLLKKDLIDRAQSIMNSPKSILNEADLRIIEKFLRLLDSKNLSFRIKTVINLRLRRESSLETLWFCIFLIFSWEKSNS